MPWLCGFVKPCRDGRGRGQDLDLLFDLCDGDKK